MLSDKIEKQIFFSYLSPNRLKIGSEKPYGIYFVQSHEQKRMFLDREAVTVSRW